MSYTTLAVYAQRRGGGGGGSGECDDFAPLPPTGSLFAVAETITPIDPTGEVFLICREII